MNAMSGDPFDPHRKHYHLPENDHDRDIRTLAWVLAAVVIVLIGLGPLILWLVAYAY